MTKFKQHINKLVHDDTDEGRDFLRANDNLLRGPERLLNKGEVASLQALIAYKAYVLRMPHEQIAENLFVVLCVSGLDGLPSSQYEEAIVWLVDYPGPN